MVALFFAAILLYGFSQSPDQALSSELSKQSDYFYFDFSKDSRTLQSAIPTPWGFSRNSGNNEELEDWLRHLPILPKGSSIVSHTGDLLPTHDTFFFGRHAGVLDMNVLHSYEQCADMALRLHAEFLFAEHRESAIRFPYKDDHLQYTGGRSRADLESFLVEAYSKINTRTIIQDFQEITAQELRPGDLIVQEATESNGLGHLFLVLDVAINNFGNKRFLIGEGSTPAQSFHLVKHPFHLSAWHKIEDFLSDLDKSDLGSASLHRLSL